MHTQHRPPPLTTALPALPPQPCRLTDEQLLAAAQLDPHTLPTASDPAPGTASASPHAAAPASGGAAGSGQRFVGEAQLERLLLAAAEGRPAGEVHQAVLEVLAAHEVPSEAAGALPPARLARLLAQRLDLEGDVSAASFCISWSNIWQADDGWRGSGGRERKGAATGAGGRAGAGLLSWTQQG